jgi:hypothetical protein
VGGKNESLSIIVAFVSRLVVFVSSVDVFATQYLCTHRREGVFGVIC